MYVSDPHAMHELTHIENALHGVHAEFQVSNDSINLHILKSSNEKRTAYFHILLNHFAPMKPTSEPSFRAKERDKIIV